MSGHDDITEMFYKSLESTGWSRDKGLGKNEDGATSIDIKMIYDSRGVGKTNSLPLSTTAASRLDLVYQGKIQDINDIEFVESNDKFDKYDTKPSENESKEKKEKKKDKKEKKKEESKPKMTDKVDVVEATKISMTMGRGRRQQGKLKRVQEMEEKLMLKSLNEKK